MGALRRAFVLIAALVLLVSSARAGATYLFCVPMQAVMATPCCHGARAESDGPTVERTCCEVQKVAEQTPALFDGAPALALPAVTLWLVPAPTAARAIVPEPATARAPRRFAEARAGPSVPVYLQNRSLLI